MPYNETFCAIIGLVHFYGACFSFASNSLICCSLSLTISLLSLSCDSRFFLRSTNCCWCSDTLSASSAARPLILAVFTGGGGGGIGGSTNLTAAIRNVVSFNLKFLFLFNLLTV